jgi:hypothetical protein
MFIFSPDISQCYVYKTGDTENYILIYPNIVYKKTEQIPDTEKDHECE